MAQPPILECRDLSFCYPSGRRVFAGVTVDFEPGSANILQGISGSGKSTLLRLFCRLEEAESGEIFFKGSALAEYPPSALRRSVAYIQQSPTVLKGSVRDNLLRPFMFRINRGLPPPTDDMLQAGLRDFLLTGVRLEDQALSLSGGQQQRLCLLRALLLAPEVMLLDEPISALDEESRDAVEGIIEGLNQERGLTVIIASHQGFSMPGVSTRTLVIEGGGIYPAMRI